MFVILENCGEKVPTFDIYEEKNFHNTFKHIGYLTDVYVCDEYYVSKKDDNGPTIFQFSGYKCRVWNLSDVWFQSILPPSHLKKIEMTSEEYKKDESIKKIVKLSGDEYNRKHLCLEIKYKEQKKLFGKTQGIYELRQHSPILEVSKTKFTKTMSTFVVNEY